MSRPPQFLQGNIMPSITVVIGDSIVVDAVPVPVIHNYAWADPEETRQPAEPPEPAWVTTTWLETLAGAQGANILQVDVRSRVGAAGTAHHDPFGSFANAIADEIASLFVGLRPGGGAFFWIPVLDFITDPDAPPETGYCIVMQAFDGRLGQPDTRNYLGVLNGYHRIVMRLRFMLQRDQLRNAGFMTDQVGGKP